MKRIFLFAIISIFTSQIYAQSSKNISLLGKKTYSNILSDVWGYVDPQGVEYALVGVLNGTSIVDVSNPANPVEKFFIPGPNSTWRDLKVWDKHLYVTNETSGGVTIIDMTYLPDSIKTTTWTGNNGVTFSSAHNIWIDEKGFAYIFGSNYGAGGAIIADLKPNPKVPQVVSVYNVAYIHDGFVRNDTMWSAEVNIGRFSIVDVSDKTPSTISASKILGFQQTPSNFTHNIWPSDDGKYAFTTDEKSNAYIGSYDIQDPTDIKELDRIRSNPGSGVIPHNVFYHNSFLVTSYYRDGVTIMDASDPENIILTGYYDTSPLSGSGFNGAWGVYPYLPSGNILVSDIENGLYVLNAAYSKAAYLRGTVTDVLTNNPINDALVEIVGQNISDKTTLTGTFKTGIADPGNYSIKISKYGYKDTILTNVALTTGNTTVLNVELKPIIPIMVKIRAKDKETDAFIGSFNLIVKVSDQEVNTPVNSGQITFQLFAEDHTFYVQKWGYNALLVDTFLSDTTSDLTFYLEKGYQDDFNFHLGWNRTGDAQSGKWDRREPIGTFFNSLPANPISDVPGDFGGFAFITGNLDTDQPGADDVDNGATIITSPVMDLSQYKDPEISYYRWFVNVGGSSAPNDSLFVQINNGDSTVMVDLIKGGDMNQHIWMPVTIKVKDFIGLSNNMTISFTAVDRDPGHIVEAGIDRFLVTDNVNTAVGNINNIDDRLSIYPNPFSSSFIIDYNLGHTTSTGELSIFDITGKIIKNLELKNYAGKIIISDIDQPGVYFVRIISDEQEVISKQIIKIR